MLEFWDRYELLILLIVSINALFMFFYSFLVRNRKPWFQYYWKAGFLWVICLCNVLERIVLLSGAMVIIRKVISLVAFLSGIYFTVKGMMLERRYRKSRGSTGS